MLLDTELAGWWNWSRVRVPQSVFGEQSGWRGSVQPGAFWPIFRLKGGRRPCCSDPAQVHSDKSQCLSTRRRSG